MQYIGCLLIPICSHFSLFVTVTISPLRYSSMKGLQLYILHKSPSVSIRLS